MKVLIDTHIILWAITDSEKLPNTARKILLSFDNEIFYSTASTWEVSIKHSLHPDQMPISGKEFSDYCRLAGYKMLPIEDKHISALETLRRVKNAPKHKDPFDRMIIAQAKAEGMLFVTHDSLLPYYNEPFIIPV